MPRTKKQRKLLKLQLYREGNLLGPWQGSLHSWLCCRAWRPGESCTWFGMRGPALVREQEGTIRAVRSSLSGRTVPCDSAFPMHWLPCSPWVPRLVEQHSLVRRPFHLGPALENPALLMRKLPSQRFCSLFQLLSHGAALNETNPLSL